MAELEVAIEKEKDTLKEQIASLHKAQEDAREEFIRINGGKKTWAHFCGLVAGAYAFVDKLTPVTKTRYESDVLSRILALQSYEDIVRETKSTPYRVKTAVMSIARRMLKIPTLASQYESLSRELKLVQEENVRLMKAMGFKEKAERGEPAILATRVDSLGLTDAALRALRKNGIRTVSDIVRMKETEFWDLRGVGPVIADEVTRLLRSAGLYFGMTA